MPTLKHLLEELKKLDVEPEDIGLHGVLYDDLVQLAENISDEED